MKLCGAGINQQKGADFANSTCTMGIPYMFLYVNGKKRLQNVKDAYHQNNLEVRIHKNRKFLPHNYLSIKMINNFERFLVNYTAENAILLPGRMPGYKRDIKLPHPATAKG